MARGTLSRIIAFYRLHGLTGLLCALYGKLRQARSRSFTEHRTILRGRKGIEIGGPSRVFSAEGIFPIYPLVASLDNVTFSSRTIWEGTLSGDRKYHYDAGALPGKQLILDATELGGIETGTYELLISSHVLEHLANPIRGLVEWKRVLAEDGHIVLVLPHKDGTFDHLRQVTPFEHIVRDYTEAVAEDDDFHVEEVLEFHDLKSDDGVGDFDEFERRIRNNVTERAMHHHVFSTGTVARMLDYAGFKILALEPFRPCHVVAIAMKKEGVKHDNRAFLDRASRVYSRSPFATDRSGP